MSNEWQPPELSAQADEWQPPEVVRANAPPTSKLVSALRGLQDSMYLGFDDEVNAAIQSAPEIFKGNFLDSYKEKVAQERADKAKAASDNPLTSIAGGVAGSVLPAGAIGKGLTKATGAVAQNLPDMARRLGAIGGIQGAAQGAGGAESLEEVPGQAALGGTVGAVAGAGLPMAGAGAAKVTGGDNVVGRFLNNYKSLSPAVTANIGPMTIGGAAGGVGGATGTLPPMFSGAIMGKEDIRPETWSSDPLSKAIDTAGWTIAGMAGGKAVKEMGRIGGAAQKTMRGEGSPLRPPVAGTQPGPTAGTFGGGGAGGPRTPPPDVTPKGPRAPEGMAPEQARKAAMDESAVSDTGEKAFSKMSEALKGWGARPAAPSVQAPPKNMGTLSPDSTGVYAPKEIPDDPLARMNQRLVQGPGKGSLSNNPPVAETPAVKPLSEEGDIGQSLMRWKQSMSPNNKPLGMVDEGSAGDRIFGRLNPEKYTKELSDAYQSKLKQVVPDPDMDYEKYIQVMRKLQNSPSLRKVGEQLQLRKYASKEGERLDNLNITDLENAIKELDSLIVK